MQRLMLCLVLSLILFLAACELRTETRPSILVIAVEGLGFESFNCDSDYLNERDMAGFKVFCEESVRFTHAFTPSTLSQPTLISLLTATYPIDHGIRTNGSEFLSASTETVAEVAAEKGYRTLFVSGGPPIFRKSGLAQGFETFDDNFEVSPGRYYRSAKDVFQVLQSWITKEVESSPFFSVLFLADLQFPLFPTQALDGEPRERSFQGQVSQIGESLGQLVQFLKDNRRWNSTTVVLVGLNSVRSGMLNEEPSVLNLKSQGVQVALYIKPAKKERDGVQQWTIDKNVSLVDVGWTLFNLLGQEAKPSKLPQLQPVSLSVALNSPSAGWSVNRLILSESAWPLWMTGEGIRYAIRQNQFLYIHDQQPQIYNTLTDRMETMKVSVNDPLWNSLNQDILGFVSEAHLASYSPISSTWIEQLELARGLWGASRENDAWNLLWHLAAKYPKEGPWVKWAARLAVKEARWSELIQLGDATKNELWKFIAKTNLREPVANPKDNCLKLFLSGSAQRPSECHDERLLALWDWVKAQDEEVKASARDRFVRSYMMGWMNDQVGIINLQNDMRWDVRADLPEGPNLVDLILSLKEYEIFKKKLQESFGGINIRF